MSDEEDSSILDEEQGSLNKEGVTNLCILLEQYKLELVTFLPRICMIIKK